MPRPAQGLVEILTDVDVGGAVGIDLGAPGRVSSVIEHQLRAAEVVGVDVVALPGRRIGVVEEENGHQSEGVRIDVDMQVAIGEDLGGKPIRIPVVVPGLAVDALLCTTPGPS